MEKHICRFCSKSFPCGRSLGGHMRSHLINISPADHPKNDEKHPKKKLPPLFNGKSSSKTDPSTDQLSYGLRENLRKTSKFPKTRDEDALLQDKACKECGKSFQSWKALFGHMKCHSVNGKIISGKLDEDSWNSCNDHTKSIMDSQSDNEATTPLCRKKRSGRMKRYTNTAATNSSSLTISNFSPPVSEIDQHEQEEVALSLIILSRDKGDWCGINSVVESSDNSPELMEAKKIDSKSNDQCLKMKSVKEGIQSPEAKTRKLDAINDEVQIECHEFEVNSPKNMIKKIDHDHDQFVRERKKSRSRKRKAENSDHEVEKGSSKFTCSICKKAFASYQALGGHRASHKKFKGCCAPRSSENSLETENSHNNNQSEKSEAGCKKSKEHECPICFKVFPSGQALGGHKRSHAIVDQANNAKPDAEEKQQQPMRDMRDFLDLNLPAPAEEECNEFKPWWIGAGRGQLLGLLSS